VRPKIGVVADEPGAYLEVKDPQVLSSTASRPTRSQHNIEKEPTMASTNRIQILVGIDFTDTSASALYFALSFAEKTGAQLHLAHFVAGDVTAPIDLGMNLPPELPEAHEARQRLERMRAMIGGKLDVQLHLRIGEPVDGLLRLVRELRPDMVIVGRHNRGPIGRALLGSVSTRLAKRCPVPVLLAPLAGTEKDLEPLPEDAPVVDPALPAVGHGAAEDEERVTGGETAVSGVGVNPPGASGYDVNPELRVRY
jgi:nucleotide-binding universal stress UspA family protein